MSEKLNELKKATMASYLSKAGGRVRSGTKIGLDFENDAYKDMRTVNKHHPNVWNPGVEKDPAKLAAATKNMETNFDLAKTFKRDAANRIKGIARAGRLLAKEEVTEEILKEYKSTESHPSLWDTHELVHKSGKVLKKGDKVKDFHGETQVIHGFQIPHKSSSTGRVFVKDKQAAFGMSVYFPGVIDAKIRKKAVKEEVVNEVSRSTIAKVAQARYNQAQDALKKKDFGGYVNKMKKAIKAGDATTPKTGWSAEDDKKNEEVVPEISASEKYRQIREAKARKGLRGAGPAPDAPKPKQKNFYNPDAEGVKTKKRMTMGDLPADVKLHGD